MLGLARGVLCGFVLLIGGCSPPQGERVVLESATPSEPTEPTEEHASSTGSDPGLEEDEVPDHEAFSDLEVTAILLAMEDARLLAERLMYDDGRIEVIREARPKDGSDIDRFLQRLEELWVAGDWVGVYELADRVVDIPEWRHDESIDWRDQSWKRDPRARQPVVPPGQHDDRWAPNAPPGQDRPEGAPSHGHGS